MSKSTHTVVYYFDWKTVIYAYYYGKCRTQLMLPMEKSTTFTGACANEIIPSINRSFVYKAKEGAMLEFVIYYSRFKSSLELVLYVCFISTLNKTLNLNLNLKRLNGNLSGPRISSPIFHAPSSLKMFTHPLYSHWICF